MATGQNKLFNPHNLPLDVLYIYELYRGLLPEAPTVASENEDANLNVLQWSTRYRRVEGLPFSLANHYPLQAVYEDDHIFKVIIKPAQVGGSEFLVSVVGHAMDVGAEYYDTRRMGLNIGYLFPTLEALGDFSKERVDSLRLESPHITKLFTGWNKVTFKQAGASYLYMRGTQSRAGLKTFPLDFLILDEYDEMPDESIALAEKRLRASDVKRRIYVSTPTLEETGISALYDKSDQMLFLTPCPNCGHESVLDFFRDVWVDGVDYEAWRDFSEETIYNGKVTVHCENCKRAIPDKARFTSGRWQAVYPERNRIRGYRLPALCFPSVNLTELCVNAVSTNPTVITELMRSDLGLAYAVSGSMVTDVMLNNLSYRLPGGRLPVSKWRNVTMGVDIGLRFNYRITAQGDDDAIYVLEMSTCKDWQDLDILMGKYEVRLCVVDAQPEINTANNWCIKWRGRALRAFYPSNEKALIDKLRHVDWITNSVDINRTMAMDRVFDNIQRVRENYPKHIAEDKDVRAQLKAPVRVVGTDAHGQEFAVWKHRTPDHYFHASVYDMIARDVLPPEQKKRYSRGG